LEVDRCHAEVATADLALDHDERDALVGHFDGVSVPQLDGARRGVVRRPSRPCGAGAPAAADHGRSRVGPLMTQKSGRSADFGKASAASSTSTATCSSTPT
jgi:hypothetical protein